jgi:FkbM family methyltransferase
MIKPHGQKGQDKWILGTVFKNKKNGYFVDLAATDGFVFSNTYVLEKFLDWNGICIEPNPKFYKKLQKNRKCKLTNIVIDKENDKEILFRTDNEECGGIVDDDTDNNYKTRNKQLKKATILKLKTKTLEYILDFFKAPKVIDYLSLDIEGAEERVLLNFPFDKYKFLSITIERPTEKLDKKLFENGYIFCKTRSYDSFYVHKSISNLEEIPKEKYKPVPKKKW